MDQRDVLIYEKHAAELTRFATTLVGASQASDVVADVVLSCVQSRAWSGVREPKPFLCRSVLNEARRWQRGEVRRRLREQLAASREWAVDPETDQGVWAAVAELSVRQRAVIFLTYWSDSTRRRSPSSCTSAKVPSDGTSRALGSVCALDWRAMTADLDLKIRSPLPCRELSTRARCRRSLRPGRPRDLMRRRCHGARSGEQQGE